ncbi:MAG: STAS domain-containing protein [Acidobacteria bacterium]|nr:STAS domain-containing protein [Acidobacteriota bacterium]
MEVIQEKRTDMVFLYLKGRLDTDNAQSLEDNLMKLIDDGASQLIIDCSQIEYIDNTGLRVLLNIAKRIVSVNGRLALHSPSQPAKEIFDKTGFSMVSRIYFTREEAITGVAASGMFASREDLRPVNKK